MQTRSINNLLLIFVTSAIILLQGCGVPGPGGGRTSSPDDAPFVAVTTVPLRIEVNEAIAGRTLDGDGLNDVEFISTSQISLVSLDENFDERGRTSIPDYIVVRGENGGYEIQFNSAYQGQLDIVAKVRFDSGTVLYAPLDNLANRSINSVVVNIFSHYLLQKLYEQVSTEEELNELLPCNDDTCSDQAYLKADLINNVNDSLRFYDVEIQNASTRNELLVEFDENADLRTHVENAVQEVTKSINTLHQGTSRAFDLTDPDFQDCLNIAADHHSVWFGLMLNDRLPDDGQDEVSFGRAIATDVDANFFPDSEDPLYPILQLNTAIYEKRTEAPTIKNYFARDTLTINNDLTLSLDTSEPIRRWESSTTDTYISTEGYVLYDRTFPQRVDDGPTDEDNIGRLMNPIYSRLYKVNAFDCQTEPEDFGDAPTWYVSSNLGSGAEYILQLEDGNLAQDDDGNFIRDRQLEQQNIFSWEIHGLETETTFDESQLDGKQYGALSFSVEYSDSGEIVKAFADTMQWDKTGSNIIENQPNDHYRSYSIARNANGTRVPLTEELTLITNNSRPIYTIESEKLNDSSPRNYGLIGLDGGARPSEGHATQNGKHLAFNLNSFDRGQGILIATELRSNADTPQFTVGGVDSNYQLMGNIITLSDSENNIFNLNGSELLVVDSDTQDCEATLTLKRRGVEHDVSDNVLSEQKIYTSASVISSECRLGGNDNGSEIELSFDNVNGSSLTMKGFVSKQGDASSPLGEAGTIIPMLWLQDDTLGLVFANLDQDLSEGFE